MSVSVEKHSERCVTSTRHNYAAVTATLPHLFGRNLIGMWFGLGSKIRNGKFQYDLILRKPISERSGCGRQLADGRSSDDIILDTDQKDLPFFFAFI